MRKNKSKWLVLPMILLLILVMAASATAMEMQTGDMVNVPAGSLHGPLFVSGNNITVDADVNGDVFAAGQSISINGQINGDLIAAGNSIRVNGVILGDVRAAANTIDVNGTVEGSLTGAANAIGIRESSQIKRDALLFGNTIDMFGAVAGQLMSSAAQININGPINGEVRIWGVEKLIFGPTAVVDGPINYRSATPAQIDPAAQLGTITQQTPPATPVQQPMQSGFPWLSILMYMVAGIVLWGAFYLLFPRLFPQAATANPPAPLSSLGWGILTLLVTPLAVLLLMITVIGIPLSLILLLAYILILCLAKIMVSDYIGRFMMERGRWEGKGNFILAFLANFLILILLSKIPIVGFFISLLIAALALGIVIMSMGRWRNNPAAIDNDGALQE